MSRQALEEIFAGVRAADFSFPTALASSQALAACRRISELVSLVVGAQSTLARGYCCRAMMSLVELQHGPEAWDAVPMRELVDFLPDENSNLAPLLSWTARDVRLRFGMSPLSVSGAACCWGTVNPEHLPALRHASFKAIVNVVAVAAEEPMASCQVEAEERGYVLRFVSVPAVWLQRLWEAS